MPLVPKNISHQGRLSGSTLAYENTHLVVPHCARVKLFEIQSHPAIVEQKGVRSTTHFFLSYSSRGCLPDL